MRRDLNLPFLAGLCVGGLDRGLSVVRRLVGPVNVPVERGLTGFGVAVVVAVGVRKGQRFGCCSIRRGRNQHVGDHRRIVWRQSLGNGHLRRRPRITAVGAVGVGFHHGDVKDRSTRAPHRGHPIERPEKLAPAGVRGAGTLLVNLHARACVHQLTLARNDVETASGRVTWSLDGHLDAVGGARGVGRRKVVRDGDATHVAVTSAPRTGLAVLARRVTFDGGHCGDEQRHCGQDEETGQGVHGFGNGSSHIIKLVWRPMDNVPQWGCGGRPRRD